MRGCAGPHCRIAAWPSAGIARTFLVRFSLFPSTLLLLGLPPSSAHTVPSVPAPGPVTLRGTQLSQSRVHIPRGAGPGGPAGSTELQTGDGVTFNNICLVGPLLTACSSRRGEPVSCTTAPKLAAPPAPDEELQSQGENRCMWNTYEPYRETRKEVTLGRADLLPSGRFLQLGLSDGENSVPRLVEVVFYTEQGPLHISSGRKSLLVGLQ